MLGLLRSLPTRSAFGALGAAALVLAALAACSEAPTAPRTQPPPAKTGRMVVYADVGRAAATINGIVIDVSGPGIVKANGSPDTLVFNLAVVGGVASGSIDVPAGEGRVVTAHAFDGVVETHRGTRTGVHVIEGINPTLSLTLLPLVGSQPITLSFGTTIVTVTPNEFTLVVGDTARMQAEVRDHNNTVLTGARVRWATLNPGRARVDTLGLVTVLDTGEVQIVGTYGTVGGVARGRGITRPAGPAPSYTLVWNGSASRNWNTANNWTPVAPGVARVPGITDSVVIPDVANDPQVAGEVSVRDLTVRAGATVTDACCGTRINVYGAADAEGTGLAVPVHLRGSEARARGSFQRLEVNGAAARLVGPTQVRENLYVYGATSDLRLAGQVLTVTNYLEVSSSGLITMADPDTMRVHGTISWNGRDQTGRLDGGVLEYFGLYSSFNFYGYRYRARGTNKVRFLGAGRQWIGGFDYINSPGNASLARWEVANGANAIYLCGHVQVLDTLAVTTPAVFDETCGGYYVRADGPITTVAGSRIASHAWALRHPAGNSRVAGEWAPQHTDVHAAGVALDSAGLRNYRHVRFYAPYQLQRGLLASGYVYLTGAGVELDLNGRRLTVGDYLHVSNEALLVMDAPADTVEVGTYASFDANNSAAQRPKMSAGLLRVRGRFYGLGFGASGSHTVELAGTGATAFRIEGMDYSRPQNFFHNLVLSGAAPIELCSNLRADSLVVRAGAALTYTPNCGNFNVRADQGMRAEPTSLVSPWLVALADTSGTRHVDGAAWQPAHTDLTGAEAYVNPAPLYRNLRIFGPTRLRGDTRASGYLYLAGATTVLDVNGFNLDVGNYLQLDNNGATLRMDAAADTVAVAGDALFEANNSAAHRGLLTAGLLRVGGRFYGLGFGAAGTHTVRLTGGVAGTTSQRLDGMDVQSRASNEFRNLVLEPGTSYLLCGHVRATDSLALGAGAQLLRNSCGNWWLYAGGPLSVAAGARFDGYGVSIYHANGTRDVAGDWSPEHTDFNTADNHVNPSITYRNLRFWAANRLLGDVTTTGQVYVNGVGTELRINGRDLRVGGELRLENSGVLVMTNPADTVEVAGNAQFNWNGSAVQEPLLTAGLLRVKGPDFYSFSFGSRGDHRTVLTGENAGTNRVVLLHGMDSRSRGASVFRDLTVEGAKVNLCGHLRVTDSLVVTAGGEINQSTCGGWYLRTDGVLTTAAGTTMRPYVVELFNEFGTRDVQGIWTPEHTYFYGPSSQVVKPTLGYRKLGFYGAQYALSGRTVATDWVDMSGSAAALDLAGHTLDAGTSFSVANQSRLFMDQSTDSILTNYFNMNGFQHKNGEITDGVIRVFGGNFDGYAFNAGGSNRVELAVQRPGGATAVPRRMHGMNYSGNTWQGFAHFKVDSAVTLELCSHALVRGTATVRREARLLQGNCGGWWLKTDGDLVVESSALLDPYGVHVANPTGTANVAGRFNPQFTYVSATLDANATAGQFKPGLEYRNVEITAPVALRGRTEFAGYLWVTGVNGVLDVNGQQARVAAEADVRTGGRLVMDQAADSIGTDSWFRINSDAGTSTLSAGTVAVADAVYWSDDETNASGSHTLRLDGAGAGQQEVESNSLTGRGFRNIQIVGSRNVRLRYHTRIAGDVSVESPVAVFGTAGYHWEIGGSLNVVAGDSISTQVTVPYGSTVTGNVATQGLVTFLTAAGGGRTAFAADGTLTVNGGGRARFTGPQLVDFRSILVNAGGALDNTGGSGSAGFRYNQSVGGTYTELGQRFGPAPAAR